MRRNKTILIVVITVMLVLVSTLAISDLRVSNRELVFTSSISADECLLCNNDRDPNIGFWGESNLGVFHLNDFDIEYIGILKYNIDGNIEKGPFGCMRTWGMYSESLKASGAIYPDRRLMTGSFELDTCEKIDTSKVEKLLCQPCIDSMMGEVFKTNELYGVGFINLETKEVRLVESSITGFGLDDYYVSIIPGNDNRLHTNVIYCPVAE